MFSALEGSFVPLSVSNPPTLRDSNCRYLERDINHHKFWKKKTNYGWKRTKGKKNKAKLMVVFVILFISFAFEIILIPFLEIFY